MLDRVHPARQLPSQSHVLPSCPDLFLMFFSAMLPDIDILEPSARKKTF
jgi:hypothetical protein